MSCGSSLQRLFERYRSWSLVDTCRAAVRRAEAAGNIEAAERLREAAVASDAPAVSALEALAAQHEVAARLSGWEWHTVCAAREEGATWDDIAHATGTSPDHARRTFLDRIKEAERHASDLTGLDRYRAVAGLDVREDARTSGDVAAAIPEGADEDRAEQLARWHSDDATGADAAADDGGWSQ